MMHVFSPNVLPQSEAAVIKLCYSLVKIVGLKNPRSRGDSLGVLELWSAEICF